jgi:hypothetical protein
MTEILGSAAIKFKSSRAAKDASSSTTKLF